MWFGRIVPLFRFPLIEGTNASHREGEEERTLPLPLEFCVGMNTDPGTALYVTYGINPDIEKNESEAYWGDDLAGWMVISPFPPSLFKSKQLMRLDVHLINRSGAFQNGVTGVVAEAGGTFLGMEVLGTGDMGSLILLPQDLKAEALREAVGNKVPEFIRSVEERTWKNELLDPSMLGWVSRLFSADSKSVIGWAKDRRVIVRERHITVPFGEFWYNYNYKLSEARKKDEKLLTGPYKSNYCLLVRDMELPVLLALFPSRPLFRVDLDVATSASATQENDVTHQVGSGMLNEAVKALSDQESNIWHVQNTYRSLIFKDQDDPLILRGVESRISIVASVPKQHEHDRPEVISSYLDKLRKKLLKLRLRFDEKKDPDKRDPIIRLLDELQSAPAKLQDSVRSAVKEALMEPSAAKSLEDRDLGPTYRRLRKVVEEHMEALAQNLEPSFVKNVDIHGPPLFRCFFSHSARPAYDERDHIDRLKLLLESEVFEVIEGEFSLGMSTEALSRGKIRSCDLFVSFLWPRDDFRTEKGEYLPPEWVIHEESFAIGQGIRVYRVREQEVMPPRYERDRTEFLFTKGNLDSWKSMEHQFRLEVRQLVQQILLGMHPASRGRDREQGRG